MKLCSNVCNRCRLVCVCKILFKSEQICGCCCKMLRGSLFWDTRYVCLCCMLGPTVLLPVGAIKDVDDDDNDSSPAIESKVMGQNLG